ncbi:unnamed protein product [Urochloa humidicola]
MSPSPGPHDRRPAAAASTLPPPIPTPKSSAALEPAPVSLLSSPVRGTPLPSSPASEPPPPSPDLRGRHSLTTPAPSPISTLPAAPAPASTSFLSSPACGQPAPTLLSPDAAPFFPSGNSGGRGKWLRWRDDTSPSDDDDLEEGEAPPSYRDILLRPAKTAAPASTSAAPQAVPPSSRAAGSVRDRLGPGDGARFGRRHRQRRSGQTRLVHGLPLRPEKPARSFSTGNRLRSIVVQPQQEPTPPPRDADGFTAVRSRRSARRRRQRRAMNQQDPAPAASRSRIPVEFVGRCFNCLSFTHTVAQCRLPPRCFRCRGFRHLARDCKRLRSSTAPASSGVDGDRRSVRTRCNAQATSTGCAAHGTTVSVDPPLATAFDHNSTTSHPSHRPDHEACSLSRSAGMDTEEEKLRLALLATALGGQHDTSVESMRRAIQELPEYRDNNFVVKRFAPGCFLVIFAAAAEESDNSSLPASSPELIAVTERTPATAMTTEGEVALTGSTALAAKAVGDGPMISSGCPEAETDNLERAPEAFFSELVAFEVQCPTRGEQEAVTTDPMLFEFGAPPACPRDIGGPPIVTPATTYKTYRRRLRSVAAPDRAALPAPVSLNSEPAAEPSNGAPGVVSGQSSEPQIEPVREQMLSPGDVGEPANPLDAGRSPYPTVSHSPKSSRKPNENLEGRKRAKLQPNRSLEEAKAATANFLASVSQALQVPLASMPARGRGNAAASIPTTPTTQGPRRSERLANQPLNSTVRPSKKGEVLVMHKLGLCQADGLALGQSRPQLASVFRGPLDAQTFAAIRDIFPAARALLDSELMAAIQAEGAFSAF